MDLLFYWKTPLQQSQTKLLDEIGGDYRPDVFTFA